MGITLRANCTVECTHCGHHYPLPLWVAVDLLERPDLRATLADDATYVHQCTLCGRLFSREHALIATPAQRRSPSHPGMRTKGVAER